MRTANHPTPLAALVLTTLIGFGPSPLVAQVPKPTAPNRPDKACTRLIRDLELPTKRAGAATTLVAMGKAAVPALIEGLTDPRPEMVGRIGSIIRAIGTAARPTVPALKKAAADDDPKRAYAARWALSAFEPQGITLVVDYTSHRIVELNAKGKVVMEIKDLPNVSDAERLPNGHYLVTLYRHGIREIDRDGEVHWKLDRPLCQRATRLPSGTTLICDYGNQEVIEVDAKGRIVWRVVAKSPHAADRLGNGNTLIAELSGRGVVEVSPKGEVVWKSTLVANPIDADRLENGNTMITSFAKQSVVELNAKNVIVRTFATGKRAYDALRLGNGDTLIGGQGFLHRYDRKGKRIWTVNIPFAMELEHY
jgi:hypothetical protein